MKLPSENHQSWSRSIFLRYGHRVLARCAAVYQDLCQLPRHVRRRVQALAGTSLAAVALAIALQTGPVSAVPTSISVNPGSAGVATDGGCSLVEAILTANDGATHGDCSGGTVSALDTITLNGNTYSYLVGYNSTTTALPQVTDPLIINGQNATIERDSGSTSNVRLFDVSYTDFTLNDATIHGGHTSTTGGGGITAEQAHITLNKSHISSNFASTGGGIGLEYGSLTLIDSTISGNSAASRGGGIRSQSATISINNSVLENNHTSLSEGGGLSAYHGQVDIQNTSITGNSGSAGGGIEVYGANLTVTGSTLTNNSATTRKGGGLYFYGVGGSYTATINNTLITGNSASSHGGGISSSYGELTINNSIITDNQTVQNGGGLHFYAGSSGSSPLNINESQISGNRSDRSGGGIYTYYGKIYINDSQINSNRATSLSGGIHIYKSFGTQIENSTISGNRADSDGGGGFIYTYGYGPTSIKNSTISDNSAGQDGGGLDLYKSYTVNIERSTISNNQAGRDGGGILSDYQNQLTISHSTISNNHAVRNGGAVANSISDLISPEPVDTFVNTTITGNTAGDTGGAFHLGERGNVAVQRSIVSGNSATSHNEIYINTTGTYPATFTANSDSILGDSSQDNTAAFGSATPTWIGVSDTTLTSDGTTPTAISGLLNTTLADNGGFTDSHALVSGSPAIDHVTSGASGQADQRYAPRVGAEDAGSIEYGAIMPQVRFNGATICSLSDAITAANTNAISGDCAAGTAVNDTIEMLTSVDLDDALPNITSEVTIEGHGRTLQGSNSNGGDGFDLLHISTASGNATVRDLMLTNPGYGDGIDGQAVETEAGSTILIENSTIHGMNTFDSGLVNNGTMTLQNATISHNTHGPFGTIYSNGVLNIKNSTITQNDGYYSDNIIASAGSITIEGSIIGGNSTGPYQGEIIVEAGATIVSNGHNVLGDNQKTNSDLFNTTDLSWLNATDITATSDGTTPTAIGGILDTTLADNGGNTLTHNLVSGSPAVDALTTCDLVSDQRGVARPQAAVCDIGAVEAAFANDNVTFNPDGSALVAFPGYILYQSATPYGFYSLVNTSNHQHTVANATTAPTYWQIRTSNGQFVANFAIFPFPLTPGS